MRSLNEVTIMGNLGRDPELRHTQGGTAVCTLSIATTRTWTKDGEKHEETEWHRVVVWGKAAEATAQHKKKGDQLLVKGYLRTREWEDKEKVKRYSVEIIAGDWQRGGVIFTGKGDGGGGRSAPHPADGPDPTTGGGYIPGDPGDDDIPF